MTNRRDPARSRTPTNATRPNIASGSSGQLSWLKRIQQALSVANVIALAAVVVALPAGLLAWHQLGNDGASNVADGNGTTLAIVPSNPTPPGNAAASPSAPTAPPLATVKAQTPTMPQTVIVTPPKSDDRTAELDRPSLGRAGATVSDIGLNKRPVWLVTIENEGRSALGKVNNTLELSDRDGPAATLSCAQVAAAIDAPVLFAHGTNTGLMSGAPLSQKDWDDYNKGVPIMLAATYCIKDDLTGRSYVRHICLKRYVGGSVLGCRKNND